MNTIQTNPYQTYYNTIDNGNNIAMCQEKDLCNNTYDNGTFHTFKTYINLVPNIEKNVKEELFDFKFESLTDNIQCAGEYLNDIYRNLLLDERDSHIPIYGYMRSQDDINSQMRAILVDWLVEVHIRFRLRPNTLHMCVYIIDAYLTREKIRRNRLQLLGIAALLIACKVYEIHYPKLEKFTEITDNAYNVEELLNMEQNILIVLKFEINCPTALEFYDIIAKAFNFSSAQLFLGRYFIESALLDDGVLLRFPGSSLAAASAYIVMKFFGKRGYSSLYRNGVLLERSPQRAIKACARELCFLVKAIAKSPLKAVRDKFAGEKYEKVSEICEEH